MCCMSRIYQWICRNIDSWNARYMLSTLLNRWNSIRLHFGLFQIPLDPFELVLLANSNFKLNWSMFHTRKPYMASEKCAYLFGIHIFGRLIKKTEILNIIVILKFICSVEIPRQPQGLNGIGVAFVMQIVQFKLWKMNWIQRAVDRAASENYFPSKPIERVS